MKESRWDLLIRAVPHGAASESAFAHRTLRCSMLISAAAPVAMAASLFGKTYGTDYLFSTRATAVSTIFSALTIPAMVALCQLLGG